MLCAFQTFFAKGNHNWNQITIQHFLGNAWHAYFVSLDYLIEKTNRPHVSISLTMPCQYTIKLFDEIHELLFHSVSFFD